MRLVDDVASSVVATLECTDDECVLNSDLEMFNSIHFVAYVDLTFHEEDDHVNTVEFSVNYFIFLKLERFQVLQKENHVLLIIWLLPCLITIFMFAA